MAKQTLVVLCNNCSQKIALPMDFDSPVFLCPKCHNEMRTPPQVFTPPKPHPPQPMAPANLSQQTHTPPTNQKQPDSRQKEKLYRQSTDNLQKETPTSTLKVQPEKSKSTLRSGSSNIGRFNTPKNKTKGNSRKKTAKEELLNKIGARDIKSCLEEYAENCLSWQPKTKMQLIEHFANKGYGAATAASLYAYAENSSEGKEVMLSAAWKWFFISLLAMFASVVFCFVTIALTGYFITYVAVIPLISFVVIVNAGQKIAFIYFPSLQNQIIQLILALIFLAAMGGFFYWALIL